MGDRGMGVAGVAGLCGAFRTDQRTAGVPLRARQPARLKHRVRQHDRYLVWGLRSHRRTRRRVSPQKGASPR